MTMMRAYLAGDHRAEALAAVLHERYGVTCTAFENAACPEFPAWIRFTCHGGEPRTLNVRVVSDTFARHMGIGTEVSIGAHGEARAVLEALLRGIGGHVDVPGEGWAPIHRADHPSSDPTDADGSVRDWRRLLGPDGMRDVAH